MTCANCGKLITGNTPTVEENFFFCNNICRYEWRKKGKPSPFSPGQHHQQVEISVESMRVHIEPPGFERRGMYVQLSYWTAAKIGLDGVLLRQVNRKFLSRKREYIVTSNFGKQISIALHSHPFDIVPKMEIDGKTFQIVRSLNVWEYLWISIPFLLVFLGGAIGGIIGGVATYSNSILMRRMKQWVPRYMMTAATTVMAFFIFQYAFNMLQPFVKLFLTGPSVEQELVAMAQEINKNCPIVVDNETRWDSASAGPGAVIVYYYTLVNYSAEQLNAEQMKATQEPYLVQNVKTKKELQSLREKKVTFVYKYFDKNQKHLIDFTILPEDYQ